MFAAPTLVPTSTARRVESLAVLGDSTAVGLGDPLPAGGWRGFGPLLATSLGAVPNANLSSTGARVRTVRQRQLPAALQLAPDVAALVVGMNDTLRADFDPDALHDDLDAVVGSLVAAGAVVLTTRFHDHTRVFRLPGPLRRALQRRVCEINDVTDAVVGRRQALCLDLHLLPGTYDPTTWSVDRLHPSERGHRMLARGFGELLAGAGLAVPQPVGLECAGGRWVTPAHRAGWLVLKGVPWLCRRGRDLLPHAAAIMLHDVLAPGVATRRSPGREYRRRGEQ